MKCRIWIFLFLVGFSFYGRAQNNSSVLLADSSQFRNPKGVLLSKVSFRGLSVLDDKVIWASGSRGCVARSIDGGITYDLIQIAGYDSTQFRDIEAFDQNTAIVMSSGTPGVILKTYNGGLNWTKVFEDKRPAIFLDAMDFWNAEEGMVIGDPINERFVLFKTIDGGNTWHAVDTSMRPWAIPGESLFAASGTCFRCMPKHSIAFVTGGSKSYFHWLQLDKKYQRFELKSMPSGSPSCGAFSFDYNKHNIVIVGGDYSKDSVRTKQAIYSYNYSEDGLELLNLKPFYSNYRSGVTLFENGIFYTCGTKGIDKNHTDKTITISSNKTVVSTLSFNVVQKAKKGKIVVAAGNKGMIGLLK